MCWFNFACVWLYTNYKATFFPRRLQGCGLPYYLLQYTMVTITHLFCDFKHFAVICVSKCYIGVLDTYANPRTLTFPDLYQVRYSHINFNYVFQDCLTLKMTIMVIFMNFSYINPITDAGDFKTRITSGVNFDSLEV